MNGFRVRCGGSTRGSRLAGILLALSVALPTQAWAYQELVVVRKSGQTSSYVTQTKNASTIEAPAFDRAIVENGAGKTATHRELHGVAIRAKRHDG